MKMNNYILIDRTFQETTPESLEYSNFSRQGHIETNRSVTFRELIKLMKEHYHPSCSPNDGNTNIYYSTDHFVKDYRTGTDRTEAMHFSQWNAPNAAKYWKLAARAAGLIPSVKA
jgi:hypothetical protein